MKKIVSLLLALLMVVSMMAVVSADAPAMIGDDAQPLSDETIHFTIGLGASSNIENWDTNTMTLQIEKALNVELEFIELPSDSNEFLQKIELMIMAGGDELPDIIMMTGSLATFNNFAGAGAIIPLTEYYKDPEMAKYTIASVEAAGYTMDERLAYVTSPNGEIYGMFGFNDSAHNPYANGFCFVYQPWLDALNMEMPTTTEEFADMLRAFKEKDPNGNGIADEIAMMGYSGTVKTCLMRYLMNPFILTQENYLKWEDGKIGFVANTEQWKNGIKWVKSLFDEGLIDELSLTQDQSALTAMMTEDPEMVGVLARISSSNLSGSDVKRSEYALLSPLTGPDGEKNASYAPILPGIRMVITSNCKHPEEAFKLGDYLSSEFMSVWTRYGEYGVDWVECAEDAIGTFAPVGYPAAMDALTAWGTLQNCWWALTGPYILPTKWSAGQSVVIGNGNYTSACAYMIGQNLQTYMDAATDHPIVSLVYNDEEQEVVTEFQSEINTLVENSWAQFVTGVKDIDAEWDNYVAQFEKIGLNEYLAAVQSAYTRMFGE